MEAGHLGPPTSHATVAKARQRRTHKLKVGRPFGCCRALSIHTVFVRGHMSMASGGAERRASA